MENMEMKSEMKIRWRDEGGQKMYQAKSAENQVCGGGGGGGGGVEKSKLLIMVWNIFGFGIFWNLMTFFKWPQATYI